MRLVNWNGSYEFSVQHEYEGKWNEKTRLITCDPHTGTGFESPQEVEDKKEIIFTYDVEFEVSYHYIMVTELPQSATKNWILMLISFINCI